MTFSFSSVVQGFVLVLLGLGLCLSNAEAAPSTQQNAKLRQLDTRIKQAGQNFRVKRYDDAAKQISAAQAIIQELEADANASEITAQLQPFKARVNRATELLAEQGVSLSGPAASGANDNGEISFSQQVAPILTAKCGSCHISDNKGGFAINNFAMLERGSAAGRVISPHKAQGSTLIDIIESGDMPRGNLKVTPAELSTLTQWINQGAKFDGPSKSTPLAELGQKVTSTSTATVASAGTGAGTVSFVTDIAPVLIESCLRCHGGNNARAGLGMTDFNRLMRGGRGGELLVAGNPADSLLIKKLRGEAGDRMPLQAPALSDEVIAKFATWISEGANFDGPNPGMPLRDAVRLVSAKQASHEQLSQDRSELANKKWRLAIPDEQPTRFETDNFLFLGNVSTHQLEEIAAVAEQQLQVIRKQLKVAADKPVIKGRMTFYVFRQRFDYSEFGKMVEKRSLPDVWLGHWKYDIIDAYGVLAPVTGDDVSLPALIAQQIAATYTVSQGTDVPEWFADGVGRAVAAKIAPKDSRVRQWDARVLGALASSKQPDSFITGGLTPEDSAVLGYSFVKLLMSRPAQFEQLINALDQGTPFPTALEKLYNGDLKSLTSSWAIRTANARRR